MVSEFVEIDTGRKKPYLLEITSQDVPMRNLPPELAGRTFVHVTDLHGGFGGTEPVYEAAIARVNALKPEYVFFTGDYIDDHASVRDYPIHEVLSRFHASRGVFGAFGNHDHRRGVVGTRRALERAGVHALCNESIQVAPGLQVGAIDDLFEGNPDIPFTVAHLPKDRTSIVLSHNPRLIEKIPMNDVVILSGHTHGGQIALPILTPKIVVYLHLRCPQVAGWYRNGAARLYVNRGLGVTGKPFRYNCPAELAIFRMVPAPASEDRPCIRAVTVGASR